MLELAEIEIAANELNVSLRGCRIVGVEEALWFSDRIKPNNQLSLTGAVFKSVERVGKALVFSLSNDKGTIFMASRLGMSGEWKLFSPGSSCRSELAMRLILSHPTGNPELLFIDRRRLATLEIRPFLHELESLRMYGPKVPSPQFTEEWVTFFCSRHSMPIKAILMEPRYVAGVGNKLSSEILFRAHINPHSPSNQLSMSQIKRLYVSINFTIHSSITTKGSILFSKEGQNQNKVEEIGYMNVVDRAGKPCPICQTLIDTSIIKGRLTFWCPQCQAYDWQEVAPIGEEFMDQIMESVVPLIGKNNHDQESLDLRG